MTNTCILLSWHNFGPFDIEWPPIPNYGSWSIQWNPQSIRLYSFNRNRTLYSTLVAFVCFNVNFMQKLEALNNGIENNSPKVRMRSRSKPKLKVHCQIIIQENKGLVVCSPVVAAIVPKVLIVARVNNGNPCCVKRRPVARHRTTHRLISPVCDAIW